MTNIWRTLEVECWARGLLYKQYLQLHSELMPTSAPLSEIGYKTVGKAMELDMENTMNKYDPFEFDHNEFDDE